MTATIHSYISDINRFIGKPATSFSKIETALDEIGRANRRKDKVAGPFVRDNAERVFIKVAALGTPRANRAARNMIRRDFLPSSCDINGLKALTKGNTELTTYVAELEARIAKPIGELDAEEVLRLDSNRFTQRLLRKQGKLAALEQRHAESAIQKMEKEKPSAAVQSRYATWRHAASPASRNVKQDGGTIDRTDTASAKPDPTTGAADDPLSIAHRLSDTVPALSLQSVETPRTASHQAGAAQPPIGERLERHDSVVSNVTQTHYPSGKEPALATAATPGIAGKGGTMPATPLSRTMTVALDLHGCRADPERSFAPHTDWESPPPTTDADYKNKGWYFNHPGRRKTVLPSEEKRFEQAIEAFVTLLDTRLGDGQARLFKHMPDLVHRLFSTPAYIGDEVDRVDEVEILLEKMREGLRGGGSRLTSTAQKLLAWMAIVWDENCLKLDDPAKVDMRERDGQFKVLENDANGHQTWRTAHNGQLNLAYTTSLIASWFDNPKSIRFDKAALQHIGVSGPVYRSRDGQVEFAPGVALSMGKRRLRSLDAGNLLHLSSLGGLRSAAHGRRAIKPITLAIDLETLSQVPLNLGNLTEFVWGETHGNTALELYVLHAMGMIRIKSQEGWEEIRAAITAANFRGLDTVLATHIERGPHANGRTFVLLGNTLAGPMGNDLIELQVRAFLRDTVNIDMPELQSVNNAYFDAYWKLNQDKGLRERFEMPADLAPQSPTGQVCRRESLQQMHQLMTSEDGQIRLEARQLLIKYAKSYYQDDRLQLCRVAEDGRTLLTGGRINLGISRALAEQMNVDGYRIRPNLAAKAQADISNTWFRDAILTRNANAYLAATQYAAWEERGGAGAVGNPLAAYIGRYDASPFFPGTILGRGIDRNISGQSNRIDAYWHLHSKFQPDLMKWLFEPFEAYVDTVKPEVSIAPSYANSTGARLFWRDGLAERDIPIFDRLIANCMYEIPHDATPDTWERFATYILRLPHAGLMARLGNSDSPQRALLASLKENIVASLTGIRKELHAWDRMHSVKNVTDQRLVDDALVQLDALPATPEAIDALSRQDLVELLFSGAITRLFNYARMSVELTQSSQRDYAQTRFALNSHAGSEPQHRQFSRTFFGF